MIESPIAAASGQTRGAIPKSAHAHLSLDRSSQALSKTLSLAACGHGHAVEVPAGRRGTMGSSRCHASAMHMMCRCWHVVAVERFYCSRTQSQAAGTWCQLGFQYITEWCSAGLSRGGVSCQHQHLYQILILLKPRFYKHICFPCVCSSRALARSKRCPPNKVSHLVLTTSKFASDGANLASQTRKLPTPLAAPLYSRAAILRASELMWSRSRSPAETPCAVSVCQGVPIQAHLLHSMCCVTHVKSCLCS